MGSEWLDTRLGDICEIRRGSSPRPIVEYLSDIEGMPWVKIADATESDSRFIRKTNQFIRHEGVDRSVIVHKGDLILSNSGTAGLPRFMEITACIHDGWQVLRKLNGITSNYLYYSLIYIRSKLLHNAYDSTMKNLTLDMVRDAIIKLPPLPEQELIAGLLTSIDDKIDLNRQINTTLESMAQALFKSWFVDFDPVIDNALAAGNEIPDELAARAARREALRQQTNKTTNKTTGATGAVSVEQAAPETGLSDQRLPSEIQQLFPDRFVFTEEMGWVPEGWEVRPLSEALYINPKVSIKKGAEATYVDMKALPTSGFMIDEAIKKEFAGGAKFKNRDVLLARITPCLENGKTGLVDFLSDDEAGFGSTEFIVLREKGSITMPFIAALSRHPEFRNHCVLNMVGSSGRQRVQNSCFDSYFVSTPTDSELLELFDQVCYPYFTKMAKCRDEALNLADLRDSLLPKLLSGQITIPDAEQQLAEVL